MSENTKWPGFTYLPEFNIAIFAALLNWPWEFMQVPFYRDMGTTEHWQGIKACSQATLGDSVIMLIAYWCVAAVRGRCWLLRPTAPQVAGFASVGLAITIAIEHLATSGAWVTSWSYTDQMPMVPLVNIGLLPVLQWIFLPPLVVWFCRRQIGARFQE